MLRNVSGFSDYVLPDLTTRHSSLFVASVLGIFVCGICIGGRGEWRFICFSDGSMIFNTFLEDIVHKYAELY